MRVWNFNVRSLVGAWRIWGCIINRGEQAVQWKLFLKGPLVQTELMEPSPNFGLSFPLETQELHWFGERCVTQQLLAKLVICCRLLQYLCLVMLELSLVFLTFKVNIICFKSPLIVQTLNHLYEFSHLCISTAVNINMHMWRLARLSPRCVNVAPARKCRWAVLFPWSIGVFDANNALEKAL